MRLLKDILYKAGLVEVIGSTDVSISALCFDSRKAGNSSLFIAVKGTQSDGHAFIREVISAGAVAVVCETLPDHIDSKVTYVKVKDSEYALGIIASNFFDTPSEK